MTIHSIRRERWSNIGRSKLLIYPKNKPNYGNNYNKDKVCHKWLKRETRRMRSKVCHKTKIWHLIYSQRQIELNLLGFPQVQYLAQLTTKISIKAIISFLQQTFNSLELKNRKALNHNELSQTGIWIFQIQTQVKWNTTSFLPLWETKHSNANLRENEQRYRSRNTNCSKMQIWCSPVSHRELGIVEEGRHKNSSLIK